MYLKRQRKVDSQPLYSENKIILVIEKKYLKLLKYLWSSMQLQFLRFRKEKWEKNRQEAGISSA